MTARTGLPDRNARQDCQDRNARTGMPSQNCLDTTPIQDCKDMTVRIGMSEHDYRAALGWNRASSVMRQREEKAHIQILVFFFALGAFVFSRSFFFALPRSFLIFALVSTKVQKHEKSASAALCSYRLCSKRLLGLITVVIEWN